MDSKRTHWPNRMNTQDTREQKPVSHSEPKIEQPRARQDDRRKMLLTEMKDMDRDELNAFLNGTYTPEN